ncbi:MAG: hypothetical protein JEZ12_23870 [Desulfobacterium sp.]|nr:hypothetical protein [Desulfobacterium sp.]
MSSANKRLKEAGRRIARHKDEICSQFNISKIGIVDASRIKGHDLKILEIVHDDAPGMVIHCEEPDLVVLAEFMDYMDGLLDSPVNIILYTKEIDRDLKSVLDKQAQYL